MSIDRIPPSEILDFVLAVDKDGGARLPAKDLAALSEEIIDE